MRFSQLFGKTLREAPASVTLVADQLAMRAALIRQAGGVRSYLPLSYRVLQKIGQLAAAAAIQLGAQEAIVNIGEENALDFQGDIK